MLTTRYLVTSLLLVSVLCFGASASVPPMISYQGKLMQPSGASVPDGTYSLQFGIYDVPTGGTPMWSETNSSVQIKGGLFSVLLGSVVNLPANIFDIPDRWFAVKVGSDPEMAPRQRIASVGYAVKAASADVATTVPDAAVTTLKLAEAAVTTATLAQGAVTNEKLASGAVTLEKLAPGIAIPVGTIVMWSGAVADVPSGWKLCDGANGTPNLTDRFVMGAGANYAPGASGGEASHLLTWAEMPTHLHALTNAPKDGGGTARLGALTWPDSGNGSGFAGWTQTGSGVSCYMITATATAGTDQPHENRPPYYALCFIMKVGS